MKYICNVILEGRKVCIRCHHRVAHDHNYGGGDRNADCDKLCLRKWKCVPLDNPDIKGAYLRDLLERV
jgi:hypothetical protein